MGALGKRLAYNRFHFLGAVSPSLIFGCAIVDIGFISTAFVHCFDPGTRRRTARSYKQPFARNTGFADTPEAGRTFFQAGRAKFEMKATLERRLLKVRAGDIEIDAEFSETDPAAEPLRICTRAGYRGWVFVRKTAAQQVSGRLKCSLGAFDLAEIDALGHNDWSVGYMRRETYWNWATFAGRLSDGRRIGLNMSCGVNETSFTENCLWLEGRLIKIDTAVFEFDADDLTRPWRIRSGDGSVDLEFSAEGEHRERLNLLVLGSNFVQLIGRFSGTVRAGGETLAIDNLQGYAEDHYAKW